jgi:type VI protein secretion system component VasF
MASSDLYNLVNPILQKICKCYAFKESGYEISYQTIDNEIRDLIRVARQKSLQDSVLAEKFNQIERPLVFFIDYFFIENSFSYSREYEPLAHVYNELSGDEKFFDMLNDSLSKKEIDIDVIEIFYIMLGLGFDGAFKREPKEVMRYINRCSELLSIEFDPTKEILCPELLKKKNTRLEDNYSFFSVEYLKSHLVLILSVITFGLFILNLICLHSSTRDYINILNKTLQNASPYKNTFDEQENYFDAKAVEPIKKESLNKNEQVNKEQK